MRNYGIYLSGTGHPPLASLQAPNSEAAVTEYAQNEQKRGSRYPVEWYLEHFVAQPILGENPNP